MKHTDKLIFLDIDGVMTAIDDKTSYLSCGKAENYKLSDKCINNLKKLIEETDAKIVLTTNWTRLESRGIDHWTYNGEKMMSPIPKLKEIFGNRIIDMIPPIKGLTKAYRLILWFEDNDYDIHFDNYVIFDDDFSEAYHTTTDYGINKHFIKTDEYFGLTENDIEKASIILTDKED